MQVNPEVLLAAFSVRLLSVKDVAERARIPITTLYQVLGDRGRRDEHGLVNIGPETGRKIRELLDEVPSMIPLKVEPQGPRRLPSDLPVNMVTTPEEQVRNFHRIREAVKPNSP